MKLFSIFIVYRYYVAHDIVVSSSRKEYPYTRYADEGANIFFGFNKIAANVHLPQFRACGEYILNTHFLFHHSPPPLLP